MNSTNSNSPSPTTKIRRRSFPRSFWYGICVKFQNGGYKSQVAFLKSEDSGDLLSAADQRTFSRMYEKFTSGTLRNEEGRRFRGGSRSEANNPEEDTSYISSNTNDNHVSENELPSSTSFTYKPSTIVSSFLLLLEYLQTKIHDQTLETAPSSATSNTTSTTCNNTNTTNTKLIVAAVQLHTQYDPAHAADGSLEELKNFFDRAVNATVIAVQQYGATLVLLPELFLGPYFCQSQESSLFSIAMTVVEDVFPYHKLSSNAFIATMQLLAKRLGAVLPISFFERCNNVYYNSVVVIDADGTLVGKYRKSHIPDGAGYQEKFYFSPGDTGFQVFQTKVGNIGIGICWDQWFPEAARAMTLLGADILLYPTAIGSEPGNSTLDSTLHWQRTMQGHAAANMIPVVASNRYGTEILLHEEEEKGEKQRITFYGKSFITNESGEIIMEAQPSANDDDNHIILTSYIDTISNRSKRSSWGLFRDRRPDLYGILLTKDGKTKYPS
jgi:N-carbamoylputrescine amidase